jgi:hypothetical protein
MVLYKICFAGPGQVKRGLELDLDMVLDAVFTVNGKNIHAPTFKQILMNF